MPAAIFDDEDSSPFDPDDLKMPESPRLRRASDLIGLATSLLLGESHDVFRDMNWYPADGGTAMAPDVLVLPAGAWVAPPGTPADEPLKSYRQDRTEGPPPVVVVEVPSASDGFVAMLAKAGRCQQLGAVFHIVSVHEPRSVLRFGPDDQPVPAERFEARSWVDRPIPELGGLRIGFEGDDLVVELPDGTRATSDEALVVEARQRAALAEDRAADAERRADSLARQLRDLGVEPGG